MVWVNLTRPSRFYHRLHIDTILGPVGRATRWRFVCHLCHGFFGLSPQLKSGSSCGRSKKLDLQAQTGCFSRASALTRQYKLCIVISPEAMHERNHLLVTKRGDDALRRISSLSDSLNKPATDDYMFDNTFYSAVAAQGKGPHCCEGHAHGLLILLAPTPSLELTFRSLK